MTEVEWLKCIYPTEMLRQLVCGHTSIRKVVLLLIAVTRGGGEEYSQASKAITAGLERFIEGILSKEELDVIYRDHGRTSGAPSSFTLENAHYSIATSKPARKAASLLIRDIFGNPFRPVTFDPRWRTTDVGGVAQAIYEDRAFDRLPILADALMDAGCDNDDILAHCRSDGPHVRGCWVLDLVLGKE